jgi:hypothetical protein
VRWPKPSQIIQKIVAAAVAHTTKNPGYGFTGDTIHQPDPSRFYGSLVYAGEY